MNEIARLKQKLEIKNNDKFNNDIEQKIALFKSKNELLLPPDLSEYFTLLNNTSNRTDINLYRFYNIDEFASIETELAHWQGIPNYGNIVNTLEEYKNCFVFADYMFHMFTYAIRLYPEVRAINEVYIICGDKHKIIAHSFPDFLNLYLDDSIELQFG